MKYVLPTFIITHVKITVLMDVKLSVCLCMYSVCPHTHYKAKGREVPPYVGEAAHGGHADHGRHHADLEEPDALVLLLVLVVC